MARQHTYGITGKRCPCPKAHRAKCPHSWYFHGGRGYRFSVDMQLGHHVALYADALKYGELWLRQIRDGVFVKRQEQAVVVRQEDGPTLADFAARYLAECSGLKSAGTVQKDRKHRDYYVFQPLLAFELSDGRTLGALLFTSITEGMYEEYISSRRDEGYAASTVNKDINLIAAMCRWATRRGVYGTHGLSPMSGESNVLKRKTHAKRQRAVTDEEFAALQRMADPQLWAYIRLSLITCARLTELYRLRWSDYRGMTLRIRPDATKNETGARDLPLDHEGVSILGWLRIGPDGKRYPDDDFIFGECGEEPRNIRDRFRTLLLKAFPKMDGDHVVPIEWANGVLTGSALDRLNEIDLKFSDFRHEGALRKYRAKWLLNELQKLLGHTNIQQTSTYLGVGDEEVFSAMERHGSGFHPQATTPDNHKRPQNGKTAVN